MNTLILMSAFPGEQNGVQALDDSVISYQSRFKFPYMAPKNGYIQKTLQLEKWRNNVEHKNITNIG